MSDLDSDSSRENNTEVLKARTYGHYYNHEDIDTLYKMQLTLVDPKTIHYEILPLKKKLNNFNNAFKRSNDVEADEKTIKTNLTSHREIIFFSELNEFLGFTKKINPAGKRLCEKPTKLNKIDKLQLKCNCFDGKLVNWRREGIELIVSIRAPTGLRSSKSLHQFSLRKWIKIRLVMKQFI